MKARSEITMRKSRIVGLVSSFLFIVAFAPAAFCQNADAIIRRAEDLLRGKSSKGTFVMRVITPEYTREMRMETWWVGTDKALIVIRSPKREAGNKTLKIKNEIWSYLRNTETTIRIPPSMMLQSWNGSDFTNDDLVRESSVADDYTHKIVSTDVVQSEKCWKIELIPKPDAPVVWGKLYYWVRQTDNLPARVEYYDERGKLMRTMLFSDYKVMGGRKLPATWTMINDADPGHRTEFEILDISFDIKISDRVFSFQELERGN
jgi:outer membrane lipoprotein-sorting protein